MLMGMRFPFLAALAVGAVLVSPAAASAALAPPAPTGPAPVGLVRTTVVDLHAANPLLPDGAANEIPLRIWYPAARPGVAPGPVLTAAEQNAWESGFDLPAHSLDGLGATTTAGAPPARGRHPVLLLSHGLGGTTAFHTAQATDLASHGYVVVGIDLPGDATFVDVGDGRIVPMNPNGEDYIRDRAVDARIAEIRFVVDQVQRLRGTGLIDVKRIGVFGHSLGASATAGALQADPRLRAGAMLDGLALADVAARGFDKPLAVAMGGSIALDDPRVVALLDHLHGPHAVRVFPTTGHSAFSDFVWMIPQLGLPPEAAENGTVEPAAAISGQRAFLLRFFDRYL
jgi:predicted dienelactone hydrolase